MSKTYDLAVIGGGSGGLVMAAVAAELGFNVVLFEGHKMGGDCLNYGCVPSKSLIAAAEVAENARTASKFGIHSNVDVNFKEVMAHVHHVIAKIEPHDSVERFEKLGVHVVQHQATFVGKHTLKANEETFTAKRIVIATGSSATIPPILGLEEVDYLTNETIFNLKELPKHLMIIGAGPIGCEMAQAFSRLGSKVTLIQNGSQILTNSDPELTTFIENRFKDEGITLIKSTQIKRVSQQKNNLTLSLSKNNKKQELKGSHLLIAVGRTPNLKSLKLHNANIAHTAKGITVKGNMQTSRKHVYAIGDCASKYQFTHMAGYQAGLVIGRTLFGNILMKTKEDAIPWVTYTDPEVAEVGLKEEDAIKKYGEKHVQVIRVPYADIDRARATKNTEGLLKVILYKGSAVGAGIVGHNAGELLSFWAYMVTHKRHVKDLNSVIIPYPTMSEIHKRVATTYYKPIFYSSKIKRISRLLFKILG